MSPAVLPVDRKDLLRTFLGLLTAMLLAALDQTVVATALPTIAGELGGVRTLPWIATTYLLATAVATPVFGKLCDGHGTRRTYLVAIALFVGGSVATAGAGSLPVLIAGRAIQGVGAGGLVVGAQAVLGELIPPAERGRYMGWLLSVFAAANVVGPTAGGLFTEHLSWRWAFYMNVPVGLIAAALTATSLSRRTRRSEGHFDYLGFALLATAVSALVLALVLDSTIWTWTLLRLLALVVAGAASVAFVFVESRARNPLISLRVLRDGTTWTATASIACVSFTVLAVSTYVPVLLQTVYQQPPTAAGLGMVPLAACMLVATTWAGRRIARTGRYRNFPIAGTALLLIGTALLATLGVSKGYPTVIVSLILIGIGLGLSTQILMLAVQNSAPPGHLGVATSTASFFRSLGGFVGVEIAGQIFATRLMRSLPRDTSTGEGVTPARIQSLTAHGHVTPAAFSHALHIAFAATLPVISAALILALVHPEVALRRHSARPPA